MHRDFSPWESHGEPCCRWRIVGDSCKISGSTEVSRTLLGSVFQSKRVLDVFQSIGTGLFTISELLCSFMFLYIGNT